VLISCSTPIEVAHTKAGYKIYTLHSFLSLRTDEMHQKSRRAKLEYGRPISSIFHSWIVRLSEDVRLVSLLNKKAVLSQKWQRDAPNICVTVCPEKFRDSLTIPTATFHTFFDRLLFQSTLWMHVQNLKSVALPVPEIIGGTQEILGSLSLHPRSLFSQVFNGLLSEGPSECTCQIWRP